MTTELGSYGVPAGRTASAGAAEGGLPASAGAFGSRGTLVLRSVR